MNKTSGRFYFGKNIQMNNNQRNCLENKKEKWAKLIKEGY